jgi:hypothetical protein
MFWCHAGSDGNGYAALWQASKLKKMWVKVDENAGRAIDNHVGK